MKGLTLQHISKSFGENKVLQNINIHVQDGELVCLLGTSGCGKTTLFNIIAGLLPPDEGEVLIDDCCITGQTGKISYMLQKDLLLPYRTVEDNIALPLLLRKQKKKQARAEVAKHLKQFGLEGMAKKYPAQLSGGMRQRAALLRTYLFSKNWVLLDEPFSALDPFTKSTLQEWFLGVMKELSLTALFITHDIDEAILLSNRIYLLGGGKPSGILHEIKIAPEDRANADFKLSEAFLGYKRSILEKLC